MLNSIDKGFITFTANGGQFKHLSGFCGKQLDNNQ
jgi:hypothetical protein